MNDLKPVFWTTQAQIDSVPVHHGLSAWPDKSVRRDKGELIPVCAMPDTHRVVSVELLRLAHSECFKNFSSSDSKTVASQLRAIIDNKEQS